MSVSYQLIEILANGKFHSGESLGDALGVSRAAIWKHVERVRRMGVSVQAIRGKGYRLCSSLELLDRERILAALGNEDLGLTRLDLFHQIDSTNEYFRQLPNVQSGSVCIAEQQTQGRGRRGRNWVSPFGANLYLSLAWRFNRSASSLSGLSLVMGLALVQALESLGLQGAGLKWPNDLYYQGKKLAGILVEISGEFSGPCLAIIGIGVNVDMPADQGKTIDQQWSDVCQMSPERVSRNELAGRLIQQMLIVLPRFEAEGLEPFRNAWEKSDITLGQEMEVLQANGRFTGTGRGIDQNGAFLLDTPNGLRSFSSGEVSVRVRS